MFDLTDDIENSPETTIKAKPVEVKTLEDELKQLEKDIAQQNPGEKETPKNDDFNEYDISDDKELDDKEW